ncbi:uncharacterized membrane protein YidH (DUF202 family) [Chryseobacterium rhizosphaerae]|uniref:Uncharacterized membrane protein YidH (DUF202 family) n=1 Tax=Chryseobacterium rhizosphaerae TaxID=395937 RepID=A0AAE3Y711_9FLAO|nr:uncharacterized membrane protein YidH (DUF202 family) [Chryseobacterium rhizosphaerae]MDR6548588.1 uncharacterized membrane protein YidH (DUF202 family) [Chryseobacterium rhizosphaerae]SMC31583.1 hypothetical protein SAMN02787074_0216 [Chryseobacterium sp. YR221]
MSWTLPYFFLILTLILFAGISYLVMRLFKRWTQKSKYASYLNVLVFVSSFLVILFITFIIFLINLNLGR